MRKEHVCDNWSEWHLAIISITWLMLLTIFRVDIFGPFYIPVTTTYWPSSRRRSGAAYRENSQHFKAENYQNNGDCSQVWRLNIIHHKNINYLEIIDYYDMVLIVVQQKIKGVEFSWGTTSQNLEGHQRGKFWMLWGNVNKMSVTARLYGFKVSAWM